MKPNLAFLKKVQDGKVYIYASYSSKRGRQDKFVGGETTARNHEKAGYVKIKTPPHVLGRGVVSLTESGMSALANGLSAPGQDGST